MVKSEIFLVNVYLDNTTEGRAVMILTLLVFLTHPKGQFFSKFAKKLKQQNFPLYLWA